MKMKLVFAVCSSFLILLAVAAKSWGTAYSTRATCKEIADACWPTMRPGKFCPVCDEQHPEKWRPMQCHGSTGYCWCVNPETGDRQGQVSRDPASLPCH